MIGQAGYRLYSLYFREEVFSETSRLRFREVIHESHDRYQLHLFFPAPKGAWGIQSDVLHLSPGSASEKTRDLLESVYYLPLRA